MTFTKPIEVMEIEVQDYCKAKGWYDTEVPFAAAMALLHEEAAEAGHAWRIHGLDDATQYPAHVHEDDGTAEGCPGCFAEPKPEGVGSEFADVLIRMLDDSTRYKLDLSDTLEPDEEIFALADEFLVNINALHGLIAGVTGAVETCYQDSSKAFASILSFLLQLCGLYGINLEAEYERKMAYNRTREYRHGGRKF
jgi:NTP pyrophosphatase (non-canonical NTP hydrolase)